MLKQWIVRTARIQPNLTLFKCNAHKSHCKVIWTQQRDSFQIFGLHYNFRASHARFACSARQSKPISILRYQNYCKFDRTTNIALHCNSETYGLFRVNHSFVTNELLFFCNDCAISNQQYKPSQWRKGLFFLEALLLHYFYNIYDFSHRSKHEGNVERQGSCIEESPHHRGVIEQVRRRIHNIC